MLSLLGAAYDNVITVQKKKKKKKCFFLSDKVIKMFFGDV